MEKEGGFSPNFSFRGWSFKTWFLGNGKTIKEIIKVAVPLIVSWISTKSPTWTVVTTLMGKLVLDSLEYFFKSYGEEPAIPELERPFANQTEQELNYTQLEIY